jgi:site-specific DNA-methyltransferase (adenine-specific)
MLFIRHLFAAEAEENFRNEIIWCYTGPSKVTANFSKKHDVILFYAKSDDSVFNADHIRIPYSEESLSIMNRNVIKKGGTIFSEVRLNPKGKVPEDWWTDIVPSSRRPGEHIGYPTQKPLALLERIIQASSKQGHWILDPFAGCGTTIAVAEKLNRKWIGIDITHLAISLLKYRLSDIRQKTESVKAEENYEVIGEPEDMSGARQLAKDDPHQFQWWADGLIEAKPVGGELGSKKVKKGADRGIDGVINFIDDDTAKPKRVIVQVKSGHVSSRDIRDMVGTVEREKAAIGVFITLNDPTKDMKKEAVSAGYYFSEGWQQNYPKIQILTIEELLNGAKVNMPPINITFKKAKTEKKNGFEQNGLPS